MVNSKETHTFAIDILVRTFATQNGIQSLFTVSALEARLVESLGTRGQKHKHQKNVSIQWCGGETYTRPEINTSLKGGQKRTCLMVYVHIGALVVDCR